jgi:hypothetical protein
MVPDRHAYIDKTIYDQYGALRRYVVYEEPSLLVYKVGFGVNPEL